MSTTNRERIIEIIGYYELVGEPKTLKHFNIKSDTLRRYIAKAKKEYDIKDIEKSKHLRRIADEYDEKELRAIAEGGRIVPGYKKAPIIDFDGERIRFGAISDTHIGSIFFDPNYLDAAFTEFNKEGCDFMIHCGDVTEGMSNRPGHIYEMSHLGYDRQKKYATELLSQYDKTTYYIDGNHDRWFIMSSGANIVEDICASIPNAIYLGHDEGDISLKGQAILKLWHGLDSNSYAISYRLQKLVESLTGGEKPHMIVAGHTHKYGKFFVRNIHVVSPGCIEKQSKWMRGKKIAAHTGFAIYDVWVNKSGISKVSETFYPFY